MKKHSHLTLVELTRKAGELERALHMLNTSLFSTPRMDYERDRITAELTRLRKKIGGRYGTQNNNLQLFRR